MTNEEKAKFLESLAIICRETGAAAAIFRECAALMRERNADDAMWEVEYHREYRRWQLTVGEFLSGGSAWRWGARYKGSQVCTASNVAPSLSAAQAAAVAWVDEKEGKNV